MEHAVIIFALFSLLPELLLASPSLPLASELAALAKKVVHRYLRAFETFMAPV